jgi:hypothetical protein
VRVKMVVQARYLVKEDVLGALERKGSTPQVGMGDHLLARDVLKRYEGQVVIPTHDRARARKVKRRGKPSRCWTAVTRVSSVGWSALEEPKAEATDPLVQGQAVDT